MPLTKEQEEKLREEWETVSSEDAYPHDYDECKPWLKSKNNAVFLEEIYPENQCELDYDKVATWWLSKINEALEAQRKEIVEGIRGHIFSRIDFALYKGKHSQLDANDREKFAKKETEKILSLPQLTGKQEEDAD